MMKTVKDLSDAIQTLVGALEAVKIPSSNDELADLRKRVDALELSRSKWEAETEAAFIRADGTLKAARNAEERERTMRRSRTNEDPESPPPSAEDEAAAYNWIPDPDDQGSQEVGMRAVRGGMAPNRPISPIEAKFGRKP